MWGATGADEEPGYVRLPTRASTTDEIASACAATAYHKTDNECVRLVELPAVSDGSPSTCLDEPKQCTVGACDAASKRAPPEVTALELL